MKTHLAEAYTCVSPCSSKITDEGFSYTPLGQTQDLYESTPHSGGYFHVDETYWASGAVHQISGLSGLPTITYGADGEGRMNTVSASSGQNPVTATGYNVASKPTSVVFGSQDGDEFSYDPNTYRITQYQFVVNGFSDTGTLGWNTNGTLASLDITDHFNSANTQNCSYTHDDLARVASANCGSVWSQTFTYDAFGNLTKAGTNSFNPGYNTSTNQMSSGATYDTNGNVLTDSLHSYAWDVNGRPTTIDGIVVTYDAQGRMVEQNKSGTYTEIVYAPVGNKLALMTNTSTLKQAFVVLPAGAVAVYNASGLHYYRHPDWLGSSRFASTTSRTMYNDLAFAPFGEPYAQSGSTDISFTGQNQDTTPNLYDFSEREYGIQGRWPSPDPAGLAAAHVKNPQTLNRYAYVAGKPLESVDPTGMDGMCFLGVCCDDSGSCWWVGEGGGGFGGGGGGDGFGCDPSDPSCGGGGFGCDPTIDPTCGGGGGGFGCDPIFGCGGGSGGFGGGFGCDPTIDPTCGNGGGGFGCDPALDPTCEPGGIGLGGGEDYSQCVQICNNDYARHLQECRWAWFGGPLGYAICIVIATEDNDQCIQDCQIQYGGR